MLLNNRGLFFRAADDAGGAGRWPALAAFVVLFVLARRMLKARALAGAGTLALTAVLLALCLAPLG